VRFLYHWFNDCRCSEVSEADTQAETNGDRYQRESTQRERLQSASTKDDINLNPDRAVVSDVTTNTGLPSNDCHDNLLMRPSGTSDVNRSGGNMPHQQQQLQQLKLRYSQTPEAMTSTPAAM